MINDDGVIIYTEEQLDSLRIALRIATKDYDDSIIGLTSGAFAYFRLVADARRTVPDIKTAREQVQKILDHAKGLRAALGAVVMSEQFYKMSQGNILGSNRLFHTYDFEGMQERHFIDTLDYMTSIAENILTNERWLRANNLLPSRNKNNQSTITQALWPALFILFVEKTGKIGFSPGGPLELFIRTVHEATDLPPVSSATLRFAVARWKQDKARLEGK